VDEDEARLPLDVYKRVLDAALELTGEPALGLRLGEHANSAMLPVVSHLTQHATTLGQAIDTIVRYSSILAHGYSPQLIQSGERVTLSVPPLRGDVSAVRLTAEFVQTGFLRLLRQYVGPTVLPFAASFAYPEPAYAAEYRKVFGGVERFGQAFTGVEFPRAWLAHAQPYRHADLHALLQTHAEAELARIERGGSMVARVQRILARQSPRELPTMAEVALQLELSARTVARKLLAEGMTYAELLEDRRTSAAKGLLESRRFSIQEAAAAMGFADAPAFHRAFKRWTGLTPKQYLAGARR
jgi:AraC-like DNA-binding protein